MSTPRAKIRKDLTQAQRILDRIEAEIVVYTANGVPDLVGTQEAAEILGKTPNAISSLRNKGHSFPAPIVTLACGPIWLREDIEAIKVEA